MTDHVEAVTVEQPEWAEVLQKMLDTRRSALASCERMLELLQPEWDRFEKRDGAHDTYVARDYADHTSAARTHRKEIAALEEALATRTQANETMREALEHWDAQATCWLESREQHARPGWMQTAIDKGRNALSGDSARPQANETMREALEPFASFAENNVDGDGWNIPVSVQNDRIRDWFGPSDFRRAMDALSGDRA